MALVTLSGLRLDLRQVTPADAPLVTELFNGLSQEDMRFRFLSSLRHLPPDQLAAMIGTDLARERWIRRLRSIESRSNHQAMEVERALCFRVLDYDGDATLALVEAELN